MVEAVAAVFLSLPVQLHDSIATSSSNTWQRRPASLKNFRLLSSVPGVSLWGAVTTLGFAIGPSASSLETSQVARGRYLLRFALASSVSVGEGLGLYSSDVQCGDGS